jgi:hypothetical protein
MRSPSCARQGSTSQSRDDAVALANIVLAPFMGNNSARLPPPQLSFLCPLPRLLSAAQSGPKYDGRICLRNDAGRVRRRALGEGEGIRRRIIPGLATPKGVR